MAASAANRGLITVSLLAATLMNSLDMTIANVALPHIQGSVSASQEQIAWVLTSYMIASAIMTPLSGWLAGRFGRKNMLLVSVGGFTVASMLCGVSDNLAQIVTFRLLQGMFGAALIPLSQSILLDISPPAEHGQAMALWGAGTLLGPVMGPALGGWLTDHLSWRWVFFINLPIGTLAFMGLWLFLHRTVDDIRKPFDFLGFAALTGSIGALQLMLDRGPTLDWFSSVEIRIYLIIAAASFWVFIIHTLTVEHPFFDRRLTKDRNFVAATLFGLFTGLLMFSSISLQPTMMQGLLGYPVLLSGYVTTSRGFGSLLSMLVVGRLVNKVDTRIILVAGMSLTVIAFWQMAAFDLVMSPWPIVVAGFAQGFGIGLTFVPVTTLAFSTIPAALRPEASTVYTLIRNIGASVGISIMQALLVNSAQSAHAGLTERLDPTDPVVRAGLPAMLDPSTVAGAVALNDQISREAMMIAYLNDFRLMVVITLISVPLVFLLRPAKAGQGDVHVAAD
jgi:MFS transporter, DHA2 family, multidrug resistance protein